MARGAGTDRPVAAAVVAPLQPAHGLTLLPPRPRLLGLQNVRRRPPPRRPPSAGGRGSEGMDRLSSSPLKLEHFQHCSASWFQMHPVALSSHFIIY